MERVGIALIIILLNLFNGNSQNTDLDISNTTWLTKSYSVKILYEEDLSEYKNMSVVDNMMPSESYNIFKFSEDSVEIFNCINGNAEKYATNKSIDTLTLISSETLEHYRIVNKNEKSMTLINNYKDSFRYEYNLVLNNGFLSESYLNQPATESLLLDSLWNYTYENKKFVSSLLNFEENGTVTNTYKRNKGSKSRSINSTWFATSHFKTMFLIIKYKLNNNVYIINEVSQNFIKGFIWKTDKFYRFINKSLN